MAEQIIYSASWLLNPDASPLSGGALLVRNGIIADVGSLESLRCRHQAPVIDYPDCAILPGFVNAHTHLELTHFPSWKLHSMPDYHPRRFTDWIIQLIKIKRTLAVDDYLLSLREGIRISLESGTTAVGEIVSVPALSDLYRQSPLAGRLYFELIGQEPSQFADRLATATEAAEQCERPPLFSGLSPHSCYTIAQPHLESIRVAAAAHALPLSVHLAETLAESEFMIDASGDIVDELFPFIGWEMNQSSHSRCTPTALFDHHGLLTPETAAVHCVHLSATDASILKDRGVHIVLCPRSNELLDVGTAPLALFKKLGIPLALGTDSLASNNSLSLWDELRFALEKFPNDLAEGEMLTMVTSGGAGALRLSGCCGTLEVGKRADFQVVTNCAATESKVMERTMREGRVVEVYLGGVKWRDSFSVVSPL